MNTISFELWWQELEQLAEREEFDLPEREDCRIYYEEGDSVAECLQDLMYSVNLNWDGYNLDWEETLDLEEGC